MFYRHEKNLLNLLKNNKFNGNISKKTKGNVVLCTSVKMLFDDGDELSLCVKSGDFLVIEVVNGLSRNTLNKNNKMIGIIESAKYVIRLYFRTGSKYTCSRTKVEKIVAIAAFTAYRQKKRLLIDNIYLKNCGVGFPQINTVFFSDIIDGKEDDNQYIYDKIDVSIPVLERYIRNNDEDDLNPSVKELLETTFRTFGAFNSRTLGCAIDDFKNEIITNQIVDERKAIDFFSNDSLKNNYKNNLIIDYICSYNQDI